MSSPNLVAALVLFALISNSVGTLQTKTANQGKEEPKGTQRLECDPLPDDLLQEIQGHQADVDAIIDYFTNGDGKGQTYSDIRDFTDTFGARLSGTQALEDSIDFMLAQAISDGFDAAYGEDVTIPHWERNEESATLLLPRRQKLNMLGLGTSVATPEGGIVADAVVVVSFDELDALGSAGEVEGKIVVYNQPFESYGQSVEYRTNGASRAAEYGAVASLVRSAASFSIGSPHTGHQSYAEGVPQIPTASITAEDAQSIYRLYQAGNRISIELIMNAETLPDVVSRNTIIDYLGSEAPDNFVVVSGHIDSWDVGVGAMDDGGGMFISYNAALALKRLGLQPRRTVRTIFWTSEEFGIYGGDAYFARHRNDSANYQLILESDDGTFSPRGIGIGASVEVACVVQEILQLTAAINTTETVVSFEQSDIGGWVTLGVPIGSLISDNDRYFWFHHSAGDSIDVENTDDLDRISALWASLAYVAADLSIELQSLQPGS